MKKLLSEKTSLILIFFGASLIIRGLILFVWKEFSLSFGDPISKEKFAQFGDFVGGIVGSIWALAGVILFYVALNEQRKDLKINQKVLEQQIKEYKLQRKELEETREVFNLQKFDNTFFNLLKFQNDITNSLFIDTTKIKTLGKERKETHKTYSGSSFFSYALIATEDLVDGLPRFNNLNPEDLKVAYIDYLNRNHQGIRLNLMELINNFLNNNSTSSLYQLGFFIFYVGFNSGLSKYVSHLNQILNFLDENISKYPKLDFSSYPQFIKAQLSDDEKLIIWLCLKIEGLDQTLFLKYEIFKGMKARVELEELKEYC